MISKLTFIIFFIVQFCASQIDTTLKQYFPLNVGNIWEYEEDSFPEYWRHKIIITLDTVMPNGKNYYEFYNSGTYDRTYYRMDDSLRIFRYNQNSCDSSDEILLFNLLSLNRSFWPVCRKYGINFQDSAKGYIGSYWTNVQLYPRLLIQAETKMFCEVIVNQMDTIFSPLVLKYGFIPTRLAKGYGIIWTQFEGPASNLVGAIINGVKIGDVTSVRQNVDQNIMLSRNSISAFPNPFNNSTVISYSLSHGGITKISVVNILGIEIEILSEGFQKVGNYTIQFNPKYLASGTYFVLVETDNIIVANKILYLK